MDSAGTAGESDPVQLAAEEVGLTVTVVSPKRETVTLHRYLPSGSQEALWSAVC